MAADGALIDVVRGPVGARFAAKVSTAGPLTADLGRCWEWTGGLDVDGYGVFRGEGRVLRAHRYAWEQVHGPVPVGLVLDHRCHDPQSCAGGTSCPHRRCVNPGHLVVLPIRDNVLRAVPSSPTVANAAKSVCVRGHPLSGVNLYIHPKRGTRHCRACVALRDRGGLRKCP